MKVKNIALAISIIAFAVGFSDLQENMWFWLGRPAGAIFAIVYFVFVILEKQVASYDADQAQVALKKTSKTPVNEKRPSTLKTALS